ncbi:MAG: response regulator transcription factor [Nocardioides sp.]|uniref:response regulator transcription factor n=1 Tax=Nocardioides sp. TaxID=35761 RepID=UPI0039E6E2CE
MESGRKLAVIVEDDPDVRNLLRTVLTQSGFETILTSNGEDGVEAVRMHDPVLTTLDVSMPGMDGVAAAAAIRRFSETYIIMITAQDDEIDVISGLNAGADEYLSKPFRPRELRARIASLLRRPRSVTTDDLTVPAPAAAPVDESVWRRGDSPATKAEPKAAPPAPQEPVWPTWQPPAQQQPVYQPPPPQPAPQQPVYQPPAQQPVYQPPQEPQGQPVYRQEPAYYASAPSVSPAAGRPAEGEGGVFRHNGLELNAGTGQVTADGAPVPLSTDEFDMLRSLMATGRRVRSKADLVLAARGESYVTSYFVTEHDKRVIDQQVASLRRKLNDVIEPARWIETVENVGYRMAP